MLISLLKLCVESTLCWLLDLTSEAEFETLVVLDLHSLLFLSHIHSLDILISLLLIYTFPPHSIPPAHLLKSASTESVPL